MFPVTALNRIVEAIDLRDHQLFAIDKLGKDIEGDPDQTMEKTIQNIIAEVYRRGKDDGRRSR